MVARDDAWRRMAARGDVDGVMMSHRWCTRTHRWCTTPTGHDTTRTRGDVTDQSRAQAAHRMDGWVRVKSKDRLWWPEQQLLAPPDHTQQVVVLIVMRAGQDATTRQPQPHRRTVGWQRPRSRWRLRRLSRQ